MSNKVFFGTYTRKTSKGIYTADLSDEGQLSNLEVFAEIGSPTYLAESKAGLIYSVERNSDVGGTAVLSSEGKLLNHYLEDGASPAYMAVDERRQLVFASNYHKGILQVFKIDGEALVLADEFHNEGSGPREEQQSAHIHFSNLTPDDKLVNVDLGTDELITFDLSDDGKLSNESRFTFEPGFGPRHIRFTNDGKYAFVLGELSSKLAMLSYEDGRYTLLKIISVIPEDFTDHNGSAAIRLSKDNKFVYVSNRGHNSIGVVQVNYDNPDMELIQLQDTFGDFPRDFNITDDEKYLVAANQNTNNASTYSIDTQTGKLTLIQKGFEVPEAVRVMFTK